MAVLSVLWIFWVPRLHRRRTDLANMLRFHGELAEHRPVAVVVHRQELKLKQRLNCSTETALLS